MRTPSVVPWLSPVSEPGQDKEKGKILPRTGAEPPGWGRGGISTACVPSEQLRSHSPSLDDVTQIHGRAGNLDNLIIWCVCVCLQHLSRNHFCCLGTSPTPLLPSWPPCVWNTSPHLASPATTSCFCFPPFCFTLCIAQTSLSARLGISVHAPLFCSSVGKKHSGNHWQWKFGLSRCVLGRKQQFLSAQWRATLK